ncbi:MULTISPECIES: Nif3-like dinuclear metal center hexameric protein [Salinibaculum]|uniref:Nif3-like dinuclear metal center hexameric protein n=1 Tax=Salinibaculum TaxID=2732368 RepID=UPI0030CAEF8C
MHCGELCQRLDEELETAAYADVDASANGLQVGPAATQVDHVAFAVDAAVETIDRAAEAGADLLVTHHGLIWDGIERLTGKHYRRIAPLLDDDLALYVSHLPLDGHQSLGNAAGVADVLELSNRAPFGTMGEQFIGQRGTAADPFTAPELRDTLAAELDTGGRDVQLLDFGPAEIRDVAIVTGSGVDWLDEAIEDGVDALVTGEGKQFAYHEAREAGIHVVLAGHYATETFGVRALQDLVADWGLRTTYIDHPTGL